MDDELPSLDESKEDVMSFHTIEQLEQLFDCFCAKTGSPETIADVIADPDPEKLQSFLNQGWHHFVQRQRDIQRQRDNKLRLPLPTLELADADASAYWAPIKHKFCAQECCRFSPNYRFGWFVEYGRSHCPDVQYIYQCHSALTAAIRKQSDHHVALLLKLGANPDGFELSVCKRFQALFLRFRPPVQFRPPVDLNMDYEGDIGSRDEILAEIGTPETVHITEEEVDERWVAEFWTSGDCSSVAHRSRYEEPAPPLVIAAGLDSTVIVDQLISHGADHLFWTANPSLTAIPDPPTPSALALSSPIHEAIASGNRDMLRHLLAKGFNPNVLPLGYVQASITPLMATFLHSEPWNEAAYNVLAEDPLLDFDLRTPYMCIHVLHAAAAHSLQALQRVERDVPLDRAGRTAYGHNLLHIACLPWAIQRYASTARESIKNLGLRRPRVRNENGFWSAQGEEGLSVSTCGAEFPAQLELLRYLLASGTQEVTAYDSDINTPPHYLAGARVINEEAIELLRAQPEGEVAWKEMYNWYGYTAEEIWEQAHRVRVRKDPWYGAPTRKVATLPKIRLLSQSRYRKPKAA
ncbi:hypothetical protein CNMCM5793_001844 [Aspergillus hiratsukae]|uniref:Ankyrin n=1 Tax=Aspergillus hiratsukae TaxID=1194566 RepID=A0A8H6UEG8_9EURO|nr:hypothetical protein CNMCM5793_001844 [Aspergillus hiratsukae]